MTISEKLIELNLIKNEIKAALIERGVPNVTAEFATYARLISQLPKYILGKWTYGHKWTYGRKWHYNK